MLDQPRSRACEDTLVRYLGSRFAGILVYQIGQSSPSRKHPLGLSASAETLG